MDWQLMSVRRILTDHLLFTRTLEHVTDIDTLMNRNSVKIYCFQIDLVFFFLKSKQHFTHFRLKNCGFLVTFCTISKGPWSTHRGALHLWVTNVLVFVTTTEYESYSPVGVWPSKVHVVHFKDKRLCNKSALIRNSRIKSWPGGSQQNGYIISDLTKKLRPGNLWKRASCLNNSINQCPLLELVQI